MAKQVIGCSNELIENIIDKEHYLIYNTLIISTPGAGKTTLLRDVARNVSNGTTFLKGQTVGIVDERGEITASYKGIAQNDVGIRTDIMSGVAKHIGIKMLIRSMAPQVIVVDEIGNNLDIQAIQDAICARNKSNLYSSWSKFGRS